jgi:transposase
MLHKTHKHSVTRIPDRLWEAIIAVLPAERPNNAIGRPIVPFKKVMGGIVYVLRTGCQWKMLPREYGFGSTCHRRFQEWARLGIFEKLWVKALKEYDNKKGIR